MPCWCSRPRDGVGSAGGVSGLACARRDRDAHQAGDAAAGGTEKLGSARGAHPPGLSNVAADHGARDIGSFGRGSLLKQFHRFDLDKGGIGRALPCLGREAASGRAVAAMIPPGSDELAGANSSWQDVVTRCHDPSVYAALQQCEKVR